jgi:6-phosphogluconolactonase (cycloisomerase 2 family)
VRWQVGVGIGLVLVSVLSIACGDSTHAPDPDLSAEPIPTPTPARPGPRTFVYLANPVAGTIAGFGVDRSTGGLTPLASSPVKPSGMPVALAIDAQARFAYVGLRQGAEALAAYAIDGETGALTKVPWSGLTPPPITDDVSEDGFAERLDVADIVLHPSGRFAFVTYDYSCARCICGVEAWLYVYAVDPETGALNALGYPPVDLGRAGRGDNRPQGVSAVSVISGSYLYTASRGVTWGGAEGCSVDSELKGFAVSAETGRPRALPGGAFAYGFPNDGEGHRWLLAGPEGTSLFLGRQQDTLRFKIKTNGVLKERGVSPRIGPAAWSPSGRVYSAASDDALAGVQVLEVQPETGDLVPMAGGFVATAGTVSTLAIETSGRFLYAAQSASGWLSAFAIDSATGHLQPVPGSPMPVGIELESADFRVVAIANVP